jgi:hypothetical protein
MDFKQVFAWMRDFYANYPIFCYMAAGILLVLLLWKPVKVLKTALLVFILLVVFSGIFYLIDSMKTGIRIEKQGMQQTEKSLQ